MITPEEEGGEGGQTGIECKSQRWIKRLVDNIREELDSVSVFASLDKQAYYKQFLLHVNGPSESALQDLILKKTKRNLVIIDVGENISLINPSTWNLLLTSNINWWINVSHPKMVPLSVIKNFNVLVASHTKDQTILDTLLAYPGFFNFPNTRNLQTYLGHNNALVCIKGLSKLYSLRIDSYISRMIDIMPPSRREVEEMITQCKCLFEWPISLIDMLLNYLYPKKKTRNSAKQILKK